jgi:glycine betaine/proline transport system permease protein
LICFLFGVPLGIISAYSKTTDTIVKPILDTMQTLPVFVYLVPVVMFFGAGQVSAVIATVIYALPPIVRCTTLGIRELPEQIDEVSNSFGASTLQTLVKVKLPMAIPAVMLGMNMASIGLSLQAGIGIVMLAIILDRMSQAWTKTQREAMGLT